MTFYTTIKKYNIHFATKFYLIISEKDKSILFESRQPPPISQHSSFMQNWLQANCLGFIETLQIWTH